MIKGISWMILIFFITKFKTNFSGENWQTRVTFILIRCGWWILVS